MTEFFPEHLRRSIDAVVDDDGLRESLASGRPLRIKYGVDCTAPDLHLGHAVNLWLMRHLQDLGHAVVFLLGDVTTQIGDPTGRSATRPVLSPEQIDANAAAFLAQVETVLLTDADVFEVRRNSEWYAPMPVSELLGLFAMTTHAQLMARDMFRDRLARGQEIALHELAYPVLQGYDSVVIRSDLTVIGSDQLFNELMGRHYQQRFGQVPQALITTRITSGLDGGAKQSKSLNNYVALTGAPADTFGRVMSLRDDAVRDWAEVYTDLPDDDVARLAEASDAGGHAARDAKLGLAEAITTRYHGPDVAAACREAFGRTFSDGDVPKDAPIVEAPGERVGVVDLVRAARPDLSASAVRRLVAQGAIRLDGVVLADADAEVDAAAGAVLRTGRRQWARIATSE